jgi:hypothetical protein
MGTQLKYPDDDVVSRQTPLRKSAPVNHENACSRLNGPSLMDEALRRARSIAADERVCTVVAAQHRLGWASLPGPSSASNVIVQQE